MECGNASGERLDAAPEAVLVDQAIEGSTEAFAELWRRTYRQIVCYVQYRGVVTDAEDMAQDVYSRAWRAIGTYRRSECPFLSWLYRIAGNLVLDRGRARKSPARRAGPLGDVDPLDHDRMGDPEAVALLRDDIATIRQQVSQLRWDQRYAITRFYFDDVPYGDIGREMGKSQGNARIIAHRGRVALRRALVGD